MPRPLAILMYHRIESARCPIPLADADEARYAIPLGEFVWQMDRLSTTGCRGVTLGEGLTGLRAGDGSGEHHVVLTFDDGNRSDIELVMPLLHERGFSATFFVCGERVCQAGGLESAMIRTLADAGMEIGSHALTHRFLSRLSESEQRRECEESKALLTDISGRETRFFSPPGGRYDRRTVAVLKSLSYEAVCTSRFGYNRPGVDPFALRRIPVVRATSRDAFDGIMSRAPGVVLPAYLRAGVLATARRLLGETGYGRLRSAIFRE